MHNIGWKQIRRRCKVSISLICIIIYAITSFSFRRVIQRAEAQAFADENGLLYVEASAKSADGEFSAYLHDVCLLRTMRAGVDEAFMRTAECVWEQMKTGGFSRRSTNVGGEDVSFHAYFDIP